MGKEREEADEEAQRGGATAIENQLKRNKNVFQKTANCSTWIQKCGTQLD